MKPLTQNEIDLLFATTEDVIHALQSSLAELQRVASSLQPNVLPDEPNGAGT